MSSPEESWRISKIANKARRAIGALDQRTQEKILEAVENLQRNPLKIKGKGDILRLRVGGYRIYFRVVSLSRSVEILLFDQRGAIKKKTFEEL